MSADLYTDLAWLPAPPADFRARCRALRDSTAPGAAAAALATHHLSESQLLALANAIADLRSKNVSLEPLVPVTLGVVSNATIEPLLPALVGSAARHGIDLRCVAADFGQTVQVALSPDSGVNRSRPDAVLIALDARGLPLWSTSAADGGADEALAASLAHVEMLCDGFESNAQAAVIVQTLAPVPELVFGHLDGALAGTRRAAATAFNRELRERVAGSPRIVFDVAALAETVGLANWHSPMQWNLAKFAFDMRFLPLYAEHVARILAALRGKSRRCLILDLDNTIWGGVVGDVGADGLVLGNGDATGEAFLDVQRAALALRERGIVLAVASKNDDAVVREVFRDHPEMLLREQHIAVFQANWDDKAANITAIAEQLSLGLDAMVFLDDSPFERRFVREFLPAVAVPELPADPALYARTLFAAGYFETLAFVDEDRHRADAYRENARRVSLASQSRNVEDYLASLDMETTFLPFDASGRSRIAQLINKTNQFNLTARRYSELDIAALEADPASFTLQVRLRDTFGDNGMICVVICRARDAAAWEIDTWLMSCRVLGRCVERAVLSEIVDAARAARVETLVGVYRPTGRNALVRDHYERLGFRLAHTADDGVTEWVRETALAVPPAPMRVTTARTHS